MKGWTKSKLVLFLLIIFASFFAVRFATSAEINAVQTIVPEIYIEQIDNIQKTLIIDANLEIKKDLKAETIKSKTTDKLIISNIIMGALLIVLLF